MSTEIRPFGPKCNLRCTYCYQEPERVGIAAASKYNLPVIKQRVEQLGGPFTLFGGEPLLMPLKDVQDIFHWGYERFGGSSVQTNGTLITSEHIELFRRFKVRVSISIDGPESLNDERVTARNLGTRRATAKTEDAIRILCDEGMPPALIITLHRRNVRPDSNLQRMNEWFKHLDSLGIRGVRLHILEVDTEVARTELALTDEENIHVFQNFLNLQRELKSIRFDVFTDIKTLLLGHDEGVTCVWKACDPYTTRAVQGVEGDGQISSCGRANKDGVNFLKALWAGYERYISLYQTPQSVGGCSGCRFFFACKGQCPGSAIHSDWRNRSVHCAVWMHLFSEVEKQLLNEGESPLSVSPLREKVEANLVQAWSCGKNLSLTQAVTQARGENSKANETAATPSRSGTQTERQRNARILWVSESAKSNWSPRIERIRRVWPRIELGLVQAGHRDCSMIWTDADELQTLKTDFATEHFEFGLVNEVGDESGRNAICVAYGGRAAVAAFQQAWMSGDIEKAAELLGWPKCCSNSALEQWRRGISDLSWSSLRGEAVSRNDRTILRDGISATNTCGHWIGVKGITHWPCGLGCAESQRIGGEISALAGKMGFEEEIGWIHEILSWPWEWSALHGIAEVKTSVLKFLYLTDNDSLIPTKSVKLAGSKIPALAGRGVLYPYNLRATPALPHKL